VNTGLSVSRVGGSAQIKAMRQVAGSLRLDMAQFRELAAFAQFGSDLDKATLAQLNRGQRLTEVLKQDQYVPLPVEKQVAIVFAGTNGLLDDLEVPDVRPFEQYFYRYLDTSQPGLLQKISERKALDDEIRGDLQKALKEAKERFKAEKGRAA
jgi:F-type H+/Na+-transporting ATPase subunit alpha